MSFQLPTPFNAQYVDPTQGGIFQQLPVGMHPVVITASEAKETQDKTGGYIQFDLEVIDGPAKGQTGPLRINMFSSSDKARNIAESQMSALSYVTGVFLVQNTQQLHGIPFAVNVTDQTLTPDQQSKKDAGQTVTPFTQVNKILYINGTEPKAQGGQAPAPAAAPVQQVAAPATGNWQAQPAPAAPAPAAQGWQGGGAAAAPSPAPAPAAAPAAAGWQGQGGAAPAGGPAWGKR